ncbi:MAG: helix-turn-helix domain-containing protein, partial [Proteobacteria bacterium]|nr:helix-turn-helix domain-containing protein [Pseudomonadota bacterium]MBU1571162.1 helix-turn-helix domain-containing protein [Pseudomonadota bacterium]
MISENKSFSFGHYLQAFRIEKGIGLEELSRETKIGIDCLSLIENEQVDKLPPEVFVKGFLRSYAKAVDADGDEAVRRYLASIGVINKMIKPEKVLNKAGLRYWHKIFLIFGAFLCIVIISVASVYDLSDKTGPAEIIKQKNRSADIKQKVIDEKSLKKPDEKLSLKVLAVKDTWLKLIIDGQNPKEYILKSGDLLELNASSGYNLLVG